MRTGTSGGIEFEVTGGDTAKALGSGDLEVLATPRLLAWLEAATCAAVGGLEPERTTVGTRVDVRHRAASPVGAAVVATATLVGIDGTLLTFEVAATDPATGRVLGDGTITRAVVDRGRFLARLAEGS